MHARFYSLLLAAEVSCSLAAAAQAPPTQICSPNITDRITVVTPAQRNAAAAIAQPPLTDIFAWPDTPMGVIKTASGYQFFASDGGLHARQTWNGHAVGNNKGGSVISTTGTLADPLGSAAPQDVSISANPDPSVNPNFGSYTYMGGGPVYQVPEGMTGAGKLLIVYHAEFPNDDLYAALGLAASSDNGLHWTDLGEVVRLNQAYKAGLDGFEIGDGQLVLSPDQKYFYLYAPDWIANGTPHPTTINIVSVARALSKSVLDAAFGPAPQHAIPFQKFYEGHWNLQPGIGGASTDLAPKSPVAGYIDIHFNSALQRYQMILSDDTTFGYAESLDALTWTTPVVLGTFQTIAAYPTAVGLGDDPRTLGKSFYVYFTHLPTDGTGWTNGALRRITLTCP